MNNSLQKNALAALLIASVSFPVLAETPPQSKPLIDRNKVSIGAGVSLNSVDAPVDDEVGMQIFAAYSLPQVNLMEGVSSSVEFGYMDYGFDGADSDGLWATYVADGTINESMNWLARLGFDFGDDSGLMVGAGVGFNLDSRTKLRLEYVIRDELDSIQLNLLYQL